MGLKAVFGLMLTLLLMSVCPSACTVAVAGIGWREVVEVNAAEVELLGCSSPTEAEWNKTYGGADRDEAYAVRQTSDGGYIIAGYASSFGAGGADFWLVKTDAYGNVKWNKTYGGIKHDVALCVEQTSDGGYIVAGYTSIGAIIIWYDFWLVKTDAYGNMMWNKTYGGASDEIAFSVQQTSDGGYILAGYTYSFGAGDCDFWLVKTDAYGNMMWNKTYGGVREDWASSVQQTIDGGYIIAGWTYSFGAGMADFWLVKTDAYGNMMWNKTYGGGEKDFATSVQQTTDGGYIIAGETYSFGAGRYDFWLVKTDAYGGLEWAKTYGGAGEDRARCVQQTSDGGYIMAGRTLPSYWDYDWDFLLVKTDANGGLEWAKTYGGANTDWANCVQQTSDGGYIMVGSTMSYGAGDEDFWLLKIVPFHDVKVAKVEPSKNVVGQGLSLQIYVTVRNPGYYTETFNITAYYNETPLQTQTVYNLAPDSPRMVVFTWNTTGVPLGNYTISVYADPVANEKRTDNNQCVDGAVTVRAPVRDVAVTEVYFPIPKTVIGKGCSTRIMVTVTNKGEVTETFNLTVHANTTIIDTEIINLESGHSKTITYTWNTTDFQKGNYTISATALLDGDNNQSDNTLTTPNVFKIVTPGDADADGDVDIDDVVLITSIYGLKMGDANFNPNVDWLDDGVINIYDVVTATSRYGEKDP